MGVGYKIETGAVATSNGLVLMKDVEAPMAILIEDLERVLLTQLGAQPVDRIPFWCQYALTVGEASKYFRIGENKLRYLINSNPEADYILWNGSRPLLKRKMLEEFLNNSDSI